MPLRSPRLPMVRVAAQRDSRPLVRFALALAVLTLSAAWLALYATTAKGAAGPNLSEYRVVPVPPVTFEQAARAYDLGDFARAAALWRRLAELGDADAQFNLGVMHARGQGVRPSLKMAVEWYRRAAHQGHAAAQYNLGVAYAKGIGLPRADLHAAAHWWEQAAVQGHVQAQYNLGLAYASGSGIERNLVQAAKWWRRAAEQGDAAAQYNLGLLYATGQGVNRDLAEAVRWWQRAAQQGFEHAAEALKVVSVKPAKGEAWNKGRDVRKRVIPSR